MCSFLLADKFKARKLSEAAEACSSPSSSGQGEATPVVNGHSSSEEIMEKPAAQMNGFHHSHDVIRKLKI